MNRATLILILFAMVLIGRAQDTNGRPGILQLSDGSSLHGTLGSISGTNHLFWSHPAAREPLQFSLSNMASMRFEQAQARKHAFNPTARFQFKNGDELVGNVRAIQDNTLRFQSWFGDDVQARLPALDAILFSSRGYNLLYEGPTGTNGWRIGRNPRSWEYKDGAFIANGADLLGRDFGLTNS
ncbi:MAG: hypothetical protein ACXW32_13910, partial [Limisphaerales bacterium]